MSGGRPGAEREELRETFEEVPELYDRARPVYPEQVFDDLVELGGLPAGGRILEIGPGTGQATLPLAERGFELLSVELGAGLAAAASRKLAGYPNVRVVNANFEMWDPGAGGFDAVVAFTAFHWIDPALRFDKAARLLRERGVLAVVETQHVLPAGGDPFWVEVQEDYDAVVPTEDNRPPSPPEEIEDLSAEIESFTDLELVAVRRYLWDVTYSPEEYIAVLETYSGHRSIEEPRRLELYERIRRRIEACSERRVSKSYLAMLNVARKR